MNKNSDMEIAMTTEKKENSSQFDEHALSIAKRQYMQETDVNLAGMFRRVADWVASAETDKAYWQEIFYELMNQKKFCPGGRVLAGAGTRHGNVLNCFVQGATEFFPESFEGIMEVAKKLALVTKVGGGNGVNLDVYNQKQTNSIRRHGFAYMNALHPDVQDFIKGLMRPPTQPDGEKRPLALRNWTRAVYGDVSPELARLARQHGVLVTDLPKNVIAVPDDMKGIIDAAQEIAGLDQNPYIDLSLMRAEGTKILGSGGTSSGPVSFLFEIFDNFLEWANLGAENSGPVNTLRYCYAPVLRVVRQGGTRRGAGMATLSIENQAILDFLTAKDLNREASEGDISTFNISILVTDAFWEALQADDLWNIKPSDVPGKYYLVEIDDEYKGNIPDLPPNKSDKAKAVPFYKKGVPAKWLWRQIAEHAWSTGEPGLIFIDRINKFSALNNLGPRYQIKSTNPCGEIPLTVGEPCDLGAINLAFYVKNKAFNFDEFKKDIRNCIRFLDDVLDVNKFALEDNKKASQDLRRLGLGVMGLADALIKLGLRYDSEAGRSMIERILSVMRQESINASEDLAIERGNYPIYDEFSSLIDHQPRRNVAVLTVAPTGTTSMLMGVSSGIEPVFSPFIWRKIGSDYRAIVAPLFKEMLEEYSPAPGFGTDTWDWDKVTDSLSSAHGSVQNLEWIPQPIREVFVCAHDIKPLDHVRMQGIVQKTFDEDGLAANSLSKTINLPNEATVQDVEASYTEAYLTGCKGVTVYRDGSRQFQVLSTTKEEKKDKKDELISFNRPGRLVGMTDMVKLTDLVAGTQRTFLLTTNFDNNSPVEVIVTSGRAGDEANADSEALGRVVSIALQYGVPVEALKKTLRGINGGLYGSYNGRLVASKADLVAIALESSAPNGTVLPAEQQLLYPADEINNQSISLFNNKTTISGENCPSCKSPALVREEGCSTCHSCGYSKCG